MNIPKGTTKFRRVWAVINSFGIVALNRNWSNAWTIAEARANESGITVVTNETAKKFKARLQSET